MALQIRPAVAEDEQAIIRLVHGERLNPLALYWQNFTVADDAGRLVAALQMRRHRDGSRELASLVVAPEQRGRGLASRLIDQVLAATPGDVFIVTGRLHAEHYACWGFHQIETRQAPTYVRRNFRMGHYGGCVMARWQRRPFNRLVILRRFAAGNWNAQEVATRAA